MKKTLAQLKRDAKAGGMVCELVERYGETGDKIPERLRGQRPLIGANTVAIIFQNADGKPSDLPIKRACLVDYDDEYITVYDFGTRPPTAEEQAVLDEWKKIEESAKYKEDARIDALSDGTSTYWRKKWFFDDHKCPWMAGWGGIDEYGKAYEPIRGVVRDVNIRGNVAFKYRICQKGGA